MQKTSRAKEKVGANPPDVTPCFEQAENYTETDYLTQTKRAESLVRQSRKPAISGNVTNNRRSLALPSFKTLSNLSRYTFTKEDGELAVPS